MSCGLSWGAVGLWAGCVVRGMCAQLVHFNGCRDHSKSAQQIINVFLNFNPLWYLAFKVFFFFFNVCIVQNSKDTKREDKDIKK